MATIIFDLDGTLIDLWPIEKTTLVTLIVQVCGYKRKEILPKLEALKKSNQSLYEMFNYFYIKFKDKSLPRSKFILLYDKAQQSLIRNNSYPKFSVFIDKKDLGNLKKKYTLALVTGSRKQELSYVLKKTKLSKFFNKNQVIASDVIKAPKSTGMPYKFLLRQNKDKGIAIGDSLSDKLGAIKAGISYVIIEKGGNFRSQQKCLKRALSTAVNFE